MRSRRFLSNLQVAYGIINLDVLDGSYELTLLFAAPFSKEDAIVNNVEGKIGQVFSQRIFDVLVNEEVKISHIDLAGEYGSHTAVEKSFLIKTRNN